MKINIKHLNKNEECFFEETIAPELLASFFTPQDEIRKYIKDSIEIKVRVYFIEHDLYLDCVVKTHLKPRCMNCLEEFILPIDETMKRVFFKADAHNLQNHTYHDEEELTLFNLNKDELDIVPIIGEHLSLIVPMSYRCSESCKGLCPYCGINRNHETCKCEEKPQEEDHQSPFKDIQNIAIKKGKAHASTKETKK